MKLTPPKCLILLVYAASMQLSVHARAAEISSEGLVYEGELVNGVLVRNKDSGKSVADFRGLGTKAAAAATASATGSLEIIIEPGAALAAHPAALDAFKRAANAWMARIRTPITVRISANIAPLAAGTLGQASGGFYSGTHDAVRNAMVARSSTPIVASLPTKAQLNVELPPALVLGGQSYPYYLQNKIYMKRANADALGIPTDSNRDSITFNSNYAFDYDNRDGVPVGQTDFESVAIHEIGHVLGFVSYVDQMSTRTDVAPTTLDLYRFQDGVAGYDPATTAEFTTFPRYLKRGGNHIFDDATTEYALENGSGQQASHWLNRPNNTSIGIMDPELQSGSAVPIKESDWRALALIGWDVVPAGPQIVVEPVGLGGVVSFGNVSGNSSTSITLTVKNTGSQPLNLSSIAVSDGNAEEFAVNTAGTLSALPAITGQTTFTVTFTPGGYGFRSTNLTIINDDADPQDQTMTISLIGNVLLPPPPTLTSFTPSGGSIGSQLTLTGTSLDTVTGVSFNGTSAQFFVLSATQVLAIVPSGATSGPISVTTLGGTVTSAGSFTISNSASGTWSSRAWTGDASSGIPATDSATDGYLQQVMHFGSGTAATVNGRNVMGANGNGAYGAYFEVEAPFQFPNTTNSLTAQGGPGSAVMAASFWYGDNHQDVLFLNLTPGQVYRASFLSVGFGNPGDRLVNFSSGTDQLVVDQNQFGQGNGIRVDYHFTASTPSQTINLDALNASNTWHLHAISLVRVVPQQPTLTTLAATNITENSAVLHGTVNANGSPTTTRFYYGSNNWSDYSMQATPLTATGWSDTAVTATLTGLKGHTQYSFLAFGANGVGANYGGVPLVFATANTVPVANDVSASTQEDTNVTFSLAVSDADADALNPTVVVAPTHGTLNFFSPFGLPHVTYMPAANYNGPDSFQYRVTDGFGGTSQLATVTLLVTPVNDPPTIDPIPNPAAILEDSGAQTLYNIYGVTAGPSDENGQLLSLTVTATSNNPALIPNPTVSYSPPGNQGALTYAPVADANGTAVITVTVSDGLATTSTNFTVDVTPVNDRPSVTIPAGVTPVGAVWTARESNRYWQSIASSADGTKLVALSRLGGGTPGGAIYTSTDSGVTWTLRTGNLSSGSLPATFWVAVTSSADGVKLAAIESDGSSGYIWISADSGLNWQRRDSGVFSSITSTADGSKLLLGGGDGNVYTWSYDFQFPVNRAGGVPGQWSSVATSSDGTKFAAVGSSGRIFISSNSGQTWNAHESARSWRSIACSADGRKLVAAVYDGQIYTSTDFGTTWTARESNRSWWTVTSSSDGTMLAAVVLGGQIYTSTDSGVTWTPRETNRPWSGLASSADGLKLAAATSGENLYTSAVAGYALSVAPNAGATTVPGFATNISPGASNEAEQTLTLAVLNDNNPLFSTQPAIALNGTLSFTPYPSAIGTATVTVTAQDNGGTANGGLNSGFPQSFTITIGSSAPVVTDPSSTNVTTNSATLGGNVTSDGGSAVTERGVVYALTSDNAEPTIGGTGVTKLTAPGTTGIFTVSAISLSASSGYSFKAYAINSLGTAYTSVATFTVTPQPSVTSSAATSITATGATLGGTVNANNAITAVTFQYGATISYGQTAAAAPSTVTGATVTSVSASVSALLPHTLYHFRANGTNAGGTTNGADATFTTLNMAPEATAQGGLEVNEDTPKPITLAGTDADGDALTFAVVAPPAHGSVSIAGSTAAYTPGANYNGSDSFTFAASDAFGGTSAPATVSLTVTAVNDLPSFAKGGNQVHPFGTSTAQSIPNWATSISDGDDSVVQALSFNINVVSGGSLFTAVPSLSSDGTLTYTPNGSAGTANLTVTLTDDTSAGGAELTTMAQTFTITIKSNNALNFDGVDDSVNVPNGLPVSLGECTIEMWIKPSGAGGLQTVMAYDGWAPGYLHLLLEAGTLRFALNGNTATDTDLTSVNLTANTWHHVAMAYSSSAKTLKWYVNGNLVQTNSYTIAVPLVGGQQFKLGSWNDNERFLSGTLDEFRIWSVARTQAEIQASMVSALVTLPPELRIYYPFDEGIAGGSNAGIITLPDNASTTVENGTLSRFALVGATSNWIAGASLIIPTPEITVSGNSISITDGDTTPSTSDHTGFGSAAIVGGTVQRTFTISNVGLGTLALGSVTVSGPNAADFNITTQPLSLVAASGTTTFQVTFDPSAPGQRSATLSFATNDSDENPFNFSIQGTGYSTATEAATANWAESYGLSGAAAAPTAVPFNDGVPNLLKYAFNMPLTGPNVSEIAPGTGSSGLPAITAPGTGGPPDSIRVEFIRRRNSGLIYTPLYSINDLSSFVPMTATPVVTIIDANWERVVVLQLLSIPLPTITFCRVAVSAP